MVNTHNGWADYHPVRSRVPIGPLKKHDVPTGVTPLLHRLQRSSLCRTLHWANVYPRRDGRICRTSHCFCATLVCCEPVIVAAGSAETRSADQRSASGSDTARHARGNITSHVRLLVSSFRSPSTPPPSSRHRREASPFLGRAQRWRGTFLDTFLSRFFLALKRSRSLRSLTPSTEPLTSSEPLWAPWESVSVPRSEIDEKESALI